ncbi:MAG: DUF4418 family protein [Lachnospiraceae bacterium]|nr:DUF4418 family protein [Lachnospiraceae bacterium]
MEKKNKVTVMDIVLLVLSAVLCLGTKFLFHACEVMEGESIMACHWAEQAVTGVAAVLVIQAVLLAVTAGKDTRKGLSLAMIPTAALTACIPGGLIRLCMMADMRCRSVMRPAVMILGIIIAVCALVNAVLEWRRA